MEVIHWQHSNGFCHCNKSALLKVLRRILIRELEKMLYSRAVPIVAYFQT